MLSSGHAGRNFADSVLTGCPSLGDLAGGSVLGVLVEHRRNEERKRARSLVARALPAYGRRVERERNIEAAVAANEQAPLSRQDGEPETDRPDKSKGTCRAPRLRCRFSNDPRPHGVSDRPKPPSVLFEAQRCG